MNLDLYKNELDYIILNKYEESKDRNKLKYEVFVQHLGELLNNLLEHAQEEPGEDQEKNNDSPVSIRKSKNDSPEKSDNKKENAELGSKESASKSSENEGEEVEDLTEEEILSLVQTCFTEIAEQIRNKGVSIE